MSLADIARRFGLDTLVARGVIKYLKEQDLLSVESRTPSSGAWPPWRRGSSTASICLMSDKHISGRVDIKVHRDGGEVDGKPDGYEELLGLKDHTSELPLKVFVCSTAEESDKFSWGRVDLETVTLGRRVTAPSRKYTPTEFNSYEVENLTFKKLRTCRDLGI